MTHDFVDCDCIVYKAPLLFCDVIFKSNFPNTTSGHMKRGKPGKHRRQKKARPKMEVDRSKSDLSSNEDGGGSDQSSSVGSEEFRSPSQRLKLNHKDKRER